jgi:hypothetical protein
MGHPSIHAQRVLERLGDAVSAVWVVTKIDENGDEAVEPGFAGTTS